MLARTPDNLVDADALIDLYGAVAKTAVDDFRRGPDVVGQAHYETAKTFLEQAGLMERAEMTEMTRTKERRREV